MIEQNENEKPLSLTVRPKSETETETETDPLSLTVRPKPYVNFGSSPGKSMKEAGELMTNHAEEKALAIPPKCLTVKGTRKFQELLTLRLIVENLPGCNFFSMDFYSRLNGLRDWIIPKQSVSGFHIQKPLISKNSLKVSNGEVRRVK